MTTDKKIELGLNIAQFTIILGGAVWAYFRLWKEGVHRPRIQFDIQCQTFQSINNEIPIEFILKLNNKGLIEHKFHSINLRVRGIKENENLSLWKGSEPRLYFPEKLVDAQVIHTKKYSHVFVEPGVDQTINYVVKIPSSYKLISARAEFKYDESKNHSIEKIFDVKLHTTKPKLH